MAIHVHIVEGNTHIILRKHIMEYLAGESALVTNFTIVPYAEPGLPFGAMIEMVLVSVGADAQTVGSGLDDLTPAGTYSGKYSGTFTVKIDSAGATDEFVWRFYSSDEGYGDWSSAVAMSGAPQVLENGVTIDFAATTGHDANDEWEFYVMDDPRIYA